MTTSLLAMSNEELDSALIKFYLEARTSKGDQYSRSALLGFRNSIECHLNNNGRAVKISKNPEFIKSNKMLDAKLRIKRRKIESSSYMNKNTPADLLRNVWFYISLYWCRRAREGQRELTRSSFDFKKDANGRCYVVMTNDECTKNHQDGENSKPSNKKETRLDSTGSSSDAYACLQLYSEKLNPSCDAFCQRPRANFQPNDAVWYENKPLGVNYLARMMKSVSQGCDLSQEYTQTIR